MIIKSWGFRVYKELNLECFLNSSQTADEGITAKSRKPKLTVIDNAWSVTKSEWRANAI
jgi:predicted SPOUT superfamily RNA methylase MTH1